MVADFRSNTGQGRASYVATAPVSDCLRATGIEKLGIVKIDIEGSETIVLESLEPHLARDRPAVLVEVLPIGTSTERDAKARRIDALLSRIGYRAYGIKKDQGNHLAGYAEQAKVGRQKDVLDGDYLPIPENWSDPDRGVN